MSSIIVGHTFIVALIIHNLATSAISAGSSSAKPLPADGIIATPGCYLLQQDLTVERDIGITIDADGVTLDLAGHALRFGAKPREGTYGVVANKRSNVRITNGAIGGFWFNVHCIENRGVRIDNVRFDDIPYIGANVANSKNVSLCDNTFTHFGYDVPKPDKDRYVIGINIGAEDAVITHNVFEAEYTGSHPEKLDLETVFVLLLSDTSQRCVVTHNQMTANTLLDRSYGLWVGCNAQVTVAHNTIRNMKYSLCIGSNARAMAGFNHFSTDSPTVDVPAAESFGIYGLEAKTILVTDNEFHGLTHATLLPEKTPTK